MLDSPRIFFLHFGLFRTLLEYILVFKTKQVFFRLLEARYVILVGLLTPFLDSNLVREVSAILKMSNFCLVPIIQMITSPPIRKYLKEKLA
jgi:hypothetical protein